MPTTRPVPVSASRCRVNKPATNTRLPRCCKWLPVVALLSACATAPEPVPEEPILEETPRVEIKVDETAMLPLLGYLQLLPRMSASAVATEASR